jgi:hypothetical protein
VKTDFGPNFQTMLPNIRRLQDCSQNPSHAASALLELQQSALKAASRELGLDSLPLPLCWKDAHQAISKDTPKAKLHSPSEPALCCAKPQESLAGHTERIGCHRRAAQAIQQHSPGVSVAKGARKLSRAQMQANWDAL